MVGFGVSYKFLPSFNVWSRGTNTFSKAHHCANTNVGGQFKRRQTLNYDFNMKDYFTLENRIKENRQYLREIQDKYEKIRQYYPLFFIYIGFIGFYTFDILQYFLSTPFSGSHFFLGCLLTVHIGVFIYVFYLFTKILILKDIRYDILPETAYSDYIDGIKEIPDNCDDEEKNKIITENQELYEYELQSYLLTLESSNKKNLDVYIEKKSILSKVIKYSLFSFIIYIGLVTFFKIETMGNEKKEIKPKSELLIKDNEEKKGNLLTESHSTLTEIDVIKIRQIVREEYEKIMQEERDKSFKESTDTIRKNINYKPKK